MPLASVDNGTWSTVGQLAPYLLIKRFLSIHENMDKAAKFIIPAFYIQKQW